MTSWHLFPREVPPSSYRRASECSVHEVDEARESIVPEERTPSFLGSRPEPHREGILSPKLIRRFLATSLASSLPNCSPDEDDYSSTSAGPRNASQGHQGLYNSRPFKANSYLDNTMNPFSDPVSGPDSPLKASPFPDVPTNPDSPDYFGCSATDRLPSDVDSKYSNSPSRRRPSSPFDLESEPLLPESPYKPLTPNSVSRGRDPESSSQHAVSTAPQAAKSASLQSAPRSRPRTPPPKTAHTSVSTSLSTARTPSLSCTISTAFSPSSSYSASTAYSSTPSSPTTVTPKSPLVRTRFSDSIAKSKTRDLPISDEIRYHDLMASYHHRRAIPSADSSVDLVNGPFTLISPCTTTHQLPIHLDVKLQIPQPRRLKPSARIQAPAFIFPPPPAQNPFPPPSPSLSAHTVTPTNRPLMRQTTPPSQAPNAATAAFPILFPLLRDTNSPDGNTSGFDWDESPRSPPKVPFMKKVKSLGNLKRSGSRSRSRGRTRAGARTMTDSRGAVVSSQLNRDQKKGAKRLGSRSRSPNICAAVGSSESRGRGEGVSERSISPTSSGPTTLIHQPTYLTGLPTKETSFPRPRRALPGYSIQAADPSLLQRQTTAAYSSPIATNGMIPIMPASPPPALTVAATSVLTTAAGSPGGNGIPPPMLRKKKLAKTQAQAPTHHHVMVPVTSTPMNTPVTPLPPLPEEGRGGGGGLLKRCCRKVLGRSK